MSTSSHGGARPGAGRKPQAEHKVKRSVTLSAAADGLVRAAMQADETYSQTLDRLLCSLLRPPEPSVGGSTPIEVLLATLSDTREPVATIYRRLGWSRQRLEQVVQAQRDRLAMVGVRLHVATKDAAAGRREQYITIDGMRYSAISRDESGGCTTPEGAEWTANF